MGPISLFDKSFLQSLNINESLWFDHFYLAIISPLFFMETLADLEKEMKGGRTAEQIVGEISAKTPELRGVPNVHHMDLAISNLLGHKIPMDGRPLVAGGRPVKSKGRLGVNFDLPPESEAFIRWKAGDFLEIEKHFAKRWRADLNNMNFSNSKHYANKLGINTAECKNINDAYNAANNIVSTHERPYDLMGFVFATLNVPRAIHQIIIERYKISGLKPLTSFAPYTAHVIKVEVFFHICVSRGFISSERPSNKIDIAYLHYLPFCKIFISNDVLHRRTAPLFTKSHQSFIWGPDLKADLKSLNAHYMTLSDDVKNTGISSFAPSPPDGNFLTGRLWDLINPNWRSIKRVKTPLSKQANDKIIEHINEFKNAEEIPPSSIDLSDEKIESLSLQRSISQKRGDWFQVPKDLKEDS